MDFSWPLGPTHTLRSIALPLAACAALCACRHSPAPGGADDDGTTGGAEGSSTSGNPEPDVPDDDEDDPDPNPELAPPPPAMRRLVAYQYRNAIGDLLGPASADVISAPEDFPLSGQVAVGASEIVTAGLAISQYEESSLFAVAALFTDLPRVYDVLGCTPMAADDEDCARGYIEDFGRRAFRRRLTEEEVEIYLALHDDGATELGSFEAGAFLVLAAMLQSPNFLYMVEVGEPDPDDPAVLELTPYELVTKLSFFLRGTTPSVEWLDAAEDGTLDTRAGIRDAARGMLAESRARAALDEYFAELYGLDALDTVVKVPSAFPPLMSEFDQPVSLDPAFGTSARGETLELLRFIVWERDSDFREVLTAEYSFVNPLMAFFYFGSAVPEDADLDTFERVDLPPAQDRAGLLGHVGLLSLLARSNRTSPTLRGKFIRNNILCDAIPPPPDDVEFMLPDDEEAPTMREKLMQHQENEACAACHISLDNLGFALEHYDGLGFYRTQENGYPIDASAELADVGEFDGLRELAAALAASPKVPACTVKKLYRHAQGHVEAESEEPELEGLVEDFVDKDQRLQALLVDIVSSPGYRHVGAEE